MWPNLKNNPQAGFTGIEILIVLTIVMIIAILVANNIQEAVAKGRDIERRTDINSIQLKLEGYWHTHENYPSSLTELNLFLEDSIDPSGNNIIIAPSTSGIDEKPAPSYNQDEQPEQGEYTYIPYNCSPTEAEVLPENPTASNPEGKETKSEALIPQICQKYVLYAWLEQAETYEKSNIHNLNPTVELAE